MTEAQIKLIERLIGRWNIEKIYSTGESASGYVDFTLLNETRLCYAEVGVINHSNVDAHDYWRKYCFDINDSGFDIYFDDECQRLFQKVKLIDNKARAFHDCPPDTYDSYYEFQSDKRFVIRHTVRGPRKEFDVTTTYNKAD